MNQEQIKHLLNQKESLHPELKEAATAFPGNLFETICATLKRNGDILLGVDDNEVAKIITDWSIFLIIRKS
jgi:ATP-dependent DNA helicase RecG